MTWSKAGPREEASPKNSRRPHIKRLVDAQEMEKGYQFSTVIAFCVAGDLALQQACVAQDRFGSSTVLLATSVQRQLTLRFRTELLQRGSGQVRAKALNRYRDSPLRGEHC